MNSKKLLLGFFLSFSALLAVSFFTVAAKADDRRLNIFNHIERNNHNNFNADRELTREKCQAHGNPTIDVTQRVKNDVDSGFGSNAYFSSEANYWNVESYTRHIKVWSLGENNWCATVSYNDGHFNAFYKQTGPGGTAGLIGADVEGQMHGGYRATFTGTLATTTDWPTHGYVGQFDYDCDVHGVCGSGRVDWVAKYFPGYGSFDQPWWGWIYQANNHGTWINAIDVLQADSGNIL